VLQSIEYLVETPGEAIPHLNMRVFYKHRGIEERYEGMAYADGVLLAERTEGIASVAHALAYCHAIERIAGCEPPGAAGLVRVLHAELERIANHLDVAVRLADAAGLAVATARFALHKERVLRLVSRLCGSRFGRGVVVPGGVTALPEVPGAEIRAELARLSQSVTADAAALMATSSFLDRVRGTGPLSPERARQHGALGPIGKAAGYADDDRLTRPYDAYPSLDLVPGREHTAGDALARLRVRWEEVDQRPGSACLAVLGGFALAGRTVLLPVAGCLGQSVPGQPAAGLAADQLSGMFLVIAFGAAVPVSVAFASWVARPDTVARQALARVTRWRWARSR
jgi:formate hydrogenlyase subunit 5